MLKIVAMIMIVISHSMPVGGVTPLISIGSSSTDIQIVIANFFRGLGQLGNAIFVICSAWFLIDSQKVKGQKILTMIIDCFIISMAWLVVTLILGYHLSMKDIIKQVFSVSFGLNWFIESYIFMYILHPLLNSIINNISQKTLLLISIVTFVMYCVIASLVINGMYHSSTILFFIIIYFYTAYFKKYLQQTTSNPKLNCWCLFIGIVSIIALVIVTNYIGLYIGYFSKKVTSWWQLMSPLTLLIAFSAFNIARNKTFKSSFVNKISSLTLLIYIIHENVNMYTYIRNDIFLKIQQRFTFDHLSFWILIVAVITFILATAIAYLYSISVGKLVSKLAVFFEKLIGKIYNKTFAKLLKFN